MKKKLKGMTLIEVIISMLIFTLLATIMVKAGSVTKSLMMNTNHLNNKTVAEAPVGAVADVEALQDDEGNFIAATDNNGAAIAIETPVTITVGDYGNVNANKYSTAAIAAASDRNCQTNMNGHLEFYVIEEPTEAPTEEPTT